MKRLIALLTTLTVAATTAVSGVSANRAPAANVDTHWLRASAQSAAFEIAMGNLARQKGSGSACTIGRMLVTDHRRSLAQIRRLATSAGVAVPRQMNPLQQALVRTLAPLKRGPFHERFATFAVAAHRLDILEAQFAAANVQRPAVGSLARNMLPTLRRHLKELMELAERTAGSDATDNPIDTAKDDDCYSRESPTGEEAPGGS